MSNSFATPCTIALQLNCPWDFTGKNTGVGCHFFLQGIFSTQIGYVSLELAGGFFTTEPPRKLVSVRALC